MSKTNSAPTAVNDKPATPTAPAKNIVLALPGMCLAEGCKMRSEKANFVWSISTGLKKVLSQRRAESPRLDKKFLITPDV